MLQIKFKLKIYQFRPTWFGVLLTLVCIPIFINLGIWQYNKAQTKSNLQSSYQLAEKKTALPFPMGYLNTENKANHDWKYKKVILSGIYETKYQILLDNQVENSRAGYHVITPLKMKGTDEYVLINRGWVEAHSLHANVPKIETPMHEVTLTGQVWIPSKKFFTLENKGSKFETVWQNMDLIKYKKIVPMKLSALMIKLDKESVAGGFVRNWNIPQARITTHIGYAYQWFGFAISAFLIFLVMSFKEVTRC